MNDTAFYCARFILCGFIGMLFMLWCEREQRKGYRRAVRYVENRLRASASRMWGTEEEYRDGMEKILSELKDSE